MILIKLFERETLMKRTKFSIICPVYNSEKYIDECICSVEEQSFCDWELIIVNDGSTDNSDTLCQNHSLLDRRIKLIKQENQGPYKSRINGIKASSGDYILFLDSDDYFCKEMLQKIFNYISLSLESIDLILFNFIMSENSKYDETSFNYEEKNIINSNEILDYVFCKNNIGNLCRFCVKRTVFENVDLSALTESRYTEDALFLSKVILSASNMKIVPDQFYFYRKNVNSVTHTLTSKDKFDRFDNYNHILELIFENNGKLNLSKDNSSLYSWMPLSYIVSSKRDKYLLFKTRCKQIRKSFMFNRICKKNRHLTKARSLMTSLIENRFYLLLRLYVLFLQKQNIIS